MIIERKNEKPGVVELWTVAPGSVVEFDDSAGYWLVTDSCAINGVAGLYMRHFVPAERGYLIAIVGLADGEFCRYFGSTNVIVVEAKVVVE